MTSESPNRNSSQAKAQSFLYFSNTVLPCPRSSAFIRVQNEMRCIQLLILQESATQVSKKNIVAIFFDLGDTIMDEGTEIKDHTETTLSAELIPGMADALRTLHANGYPLAMVADSRPNTPPNVLKQHNLLDLFDRVSISENVGAEKPDARMFLDALNALNISEQDCPRVMMVGNHLERDIVGANRLGLRSVFYHFNERRRTIVMNRAEAPRHTITSPQELLDLVAALSVEITGSEPPHYHGNEQELELAYKFAPVIRFDEAEPFLPLAAGYTIFHGEEQSPSFFRRIARAWRPQWTTAIEYAIWWDWDIGHLYELEHVWCYLDESARLVWVEASSHGAYASMLLEDGTIPSIGTHPVVYSQPGKHAFSPTPHWFEMFRDGVFLETSANAGNQGVLVQEPYARQISKNAETDASARAWLKRLAFTPTLKFKRQFHIERAQLVPWATLDAWIPLRVNWWLDHLRTNR
jgi:phosphoglycolate phosphatase-like HAD superfamily hydrolase